MREEARQVDAARDQRRTEQHPLEQEKDERISKRPDNEFDDRGRLEQALVVPERRLVEQRPDQKLGLVGVPEKRPRRDVGEEMRAVGDDERRRRLDATYTLAALHRSLSAPTPADDDWLRQLAEVEDQIEIQGVNVESEETSKAATALIRIEEYWSQRLAERMEQRAERRGEGRNRGMRGEGRAEMRSALDEIVLDGAQRMLAAALEAEVDAYLAGLAGERDERGRRLVVRNGHAEPRTITTAAP